MYIELPEKFNKTNGKNYVRVRNGMLLIKGTWNFENLMIEMTYAIYGSHKCYYCKRHLAREKITIDHVYPLDFGGVTITSNLIPACSKCNNKKTNMNADEFNQWCEIRDEKTRKEWYNYTISQKKKQIEDPKNKEGFDLPAEWIKYRDASSLIKTAEYYYKGKKYQKALEFFKKNGKFSSPIIVSRNNRILAGKTTYEIAIDNNVKKVPIIFLSNVLIL